MIKNQSLQELYAPHSKCFGCGPQNNYGLRIGSFFHPEDPNSLIAHWSGEERHEAFTGVLNGGIIGSLLDCHSNWRAATHLMALQGLTELPSTVTSDFHVRLLLPTPSHTSLEIIATTAQTIKNKKVRVESKIYILSPHPDPKDGDTKEKKLSATCEGIFVQVDPGHPAYHRW